MSRPRANGAPQGSNQWQQQLNQTNVCPETPRYAPQYTLPGVINYLTSEFTNLERFKITTNLEKSEMKYRIIELQGEVNSLKVMNEKQKRTISELQAENDRLRSRSGSSEKPKSVEYELPDVDLDVVKRSREQLANSMKEIANLLKVPAARNANYIGLPNPNGAYVNDLDDLLNQNCTDEPEPSFEENFNSGEGNYVNYISKPLVTAQYFGNDKQEYKSAYDTDDKGFAETLDVSDVETDILDEIDDRGIEKNEEKSRTIEVTDKKLGNTKEMTPIVTEKGSEKKDSKQQTEQKTEQKTKQTELKNDPKTELKIDPKTDSKTEQNELKINPKAESKNEPTTKSNEPTTESNEPKIESKNELTGESGGSESTSPKLSKQKKVTKKKPADMNENLVQMTKENTKQNENVPDPEESSTTSDVFDDEDAPHDIPQRRRKLVSFDKKAMDKSLRDELANKKPPPEPEPELNVRHTFKCHGQTVVLRLTEDEKSGIVETTDASNGVSTSDTVAFSNINAEKLVNVMILAQTLRSEFIAVQNDGSVYSFNNHDEQQISGPTSPKHPIVRADFAEILSGWVLLMDSEHGGYKLRVYSVKRDKILFEMHEVAQFTGAFLRRLAGVEGDVEFVGWKKHEGGDVVDAEYKVGEKVIVVDVQKREEVKKDS